MEIQFLLKFGQKEHIQTLLEDGLVYANSASYFKKNGDGGNRFDDAEGRLALKHLTNEILEIKALNDTEWKQLLVESGKFETYADLSLFHYYCLYLISAELTKTEGKLELDPSMKGLGNSFLLIHKPRLFVERLDTELEKSGYDFTKDQVNYYDESTDNFKLSLFHKKNAYQHQREFRYIIKADTESPIQLRLGSLKDIAEMCDSNKYQGLKFIWP